MMTVRSNIQTETQLLPLPLGERVGVRGLHTSAIHAPSPPPPLTRRASRVDLSPKGRGENRFERI